MNSNKNWKERRQSVINELMDHVAPNTELENAQIRRWLTNVLTKLEKEPDHLNNLYMAVTSEGINSAGCVPLPRNTVHGRVQVHGNHNLPHVMLAKIFRWPYVRKKELSPKFFCLFPSDKNLESTCVNPYHYKLLACEWGPPNVVKMSDRTLTFVSRNPHELPDIVSMIGKNFGDKVTGRSVGLDLPEFQGSPEYIATMKIKDAYQIIRSPVLCEVTSLAFHALGGMPGAYIKWFLEKIGPGGLFKLLQGFESKEAKASTIFALYDGTDVKLFRGDIEGEIVYPRESSVGWDSCFRPLCYVKTYGEMTILEKQDVCHRFSACNRLKDFLDEYFM